MAVGRIKSYDVLTKINYIQDIGKPLVLKLIQYCTKNKLIDPEEDSDDENWPDPEYNDHPKKLTSYTDKQLNRFLGAGYFSILNHLKDSVDKRVIQHLDTFKPVFDKLKSKYKIFMLPTTYKTVYRGTAIDKKTYEKFIRVTKSTEWKKVKIGSHLFYVYTMKTFQYKPHQTYQSFTVDPNIARDFNDHPAKRGVILLTKSNIKDFYFDPKFLNGIDDEYDTEDETIHFGKDLRAYVVIDDDAYDFAKDEKMFKDSAKLKKNLDIPDIKKLKI